MRKKSGTAINILINILILASGIVMIAGFRHQRFIDMIIFFTGVIFLVPAIINVFLLILDRHSRDENGNPKHSPFAVFASWLGTIAAIVLGATMCINPELFGHVFVFIFGAVLILAGLVNIYMLAFGIKRAKFPIWTYIIPLLIIAAGVLVITNPFRTQEAIILTFGIGLVLFSIARFVEMIGYRTISRQEEAIEARSKQSQ